MPRSALHSACLYWRLISSAASEAKCANCRQGRDEALWKPTQWTDIIEPVTDFMRINLQRFRCDEPEKAAECLSLLEALAAAADAFEPGGAATKSAGYKKVMSCIGGLRECVTHALTFAMS